MRQITKAEMLARYEKGTITEVINVGDRIIARSVEGQGNNPDRYEVVYCLLA